eukprot:scaffold48842_cov55-Phaeocystis_antarctica.AAC.2
MSAVQPRLVRRLTFAPRASSSLTISSWPWAAAVCSRDEVVVRPSPRWVDTKISRGSEAVELTAGSPASGGAAGKGAAGCGGAACCRMSSTMAALPLVSAHCRAVRPSSSSSSVLALARSRAFTHAFLPLRAADIRAVLPLLDCKSGSAECCSRTSRMLRWPWHAASLSAVMPKLVCRSTVAPRFSSTLTISRWSLHAAACSRVDVETRPP